MTTLPGTFGRYTTYTNAPTIVTDHAGVEFRGLLVSDIQQAGQLVYVVVRMDTQAVIFASPPGAGSGSISAGPSGPLKVVYNVGQNKGTATESEVIPDVFTPSASGTGGALSYEAFLALMQRLIADASKPTDAALFFVKFVNERGAAGAKWLIKQAMAAVGSVLGA